jgi:glutamate-1-semialdehyde 2,1-aminomutase
VTGAVFFTEGPVRNYRDACKASQSVFTAYWYSMLERGIIPQCYGRDDVWTLTLAHSHKDIERVISAFDDLAGLISELQRGSEIEAARTMK